MSVLDKTIGDGLKQGAFKVIPTGRYVLRVVDCAVRTAQTKEGPKEVADLKVAVQAPLDDQNLDGVNIEKQRVSGSLWLTDAAMGPTSRAIKAINPDIPDTMPIRDSLELLTGRDFGGVLIHKTRGNSDRVNVEVDKYFPL
jgi:hypothetical protein